MGFEAPESLFRRFRFIDWNVEMSYPSSYAAYSSYGRIVLSGNLLVRLDADHPGLFT